jgi:hypothetical protein
MRQARTVIEEVRTELGTANGVVMNRSIVSPASITDCPGVIGAPALSPGTCMPGNKEDSRENLREAVLMDRFGQPSEDVGLRLKPRIAHWRAQRVIGRHCKRDSPVADCAHSMSQDWPNVSSH